MGREQRLCYFTTYIHSIPLTSVFFILPLPPSVCFEKPIPSVWGTEVFAIPGHQGFAVYRRVDRKMQKESK